MTHSILRVICIGVLAVFCTVFFMTPSAIIAAELFNGRDLDGWVNVNCAPSTWTVRDGVIVCSGEPFGVLRTEKMYENFEIELEWRHTVEFGNAGLFVFADALPASGSPFPRCIECQIMDGNAGDIFTINGADFVPYKPHPKGWARAVPSEDRMNELGEWNSYKVTSRNGILTLAVNGEVVNTAYHCSPRKGYICLEAEGSEVHFRNIRIREFPSTDPPEINVAEADRGFTSLYNGVDLSGWRNTVGNVGHWTAKGWMLDYDGKSEARGDERNLWTVDEFGDYDLIIDWRLTGEPLREQAPVILPDGLEARDAKGNVVTAEIMNAGDSGVFLRGDENSQVNIWSWPVGSGEMWEYRTDESQHPDVRAAATPLVNADNPPGRWNRFEIAVRGRHVTVVLNGKTVLPDGRMPGMKMRGPIALQHHGDPVQFANIFIKTLE